MAQRIWGTVGTGVAALAATLLFVVNAPGSVGPSRPEARTETRLDDRPAPVLPQRARLVRFDDPERERDSQTTQRAGGSAVMGWLVLLGLCATTWLAARRRLVLEAS